jgi:hypothetical protein
MKKIIILIVAIFCSYVVCQAGTGNAIQKAISKQIHLPAEMKNQKLNEKVNVQFKVENGKASMIDVKSENTELKNYVIEQFKNLKFDELPEDHSTTYFIDINFKVL